MFIEDGLRGFGPDERFGVIVVLFDVSVDGLLEFGDGSEGASPNAPSGDCGEEAFDGIEPGSGDGCEVEGPARMAGEPFPHLGLLVGGIVVEHGLDRLVWRNGPLDGVEETDELLMTVPSRTLSAAKSVVVPLRL